MASRRDETPPPPPPSADVEIEEGEIPGERKNDTQMVTTPRTSHRRGALRQCELRSGGWASLSPPPFGGMSRRYRVKRDRRESYRSREHFGGRYEGGSGYRSTQDAGHEREVLVKEIHALTKRVGLQDATKSLDVLCYELKSAMKKLDKAWGLMSKSRSDHPEIVECAHRVYSGLRSVHTVCNDRSVKMQNWDLVNDLMRTAMHYRHVVFGSSQKRELENWVRELDRCCLKEGDRLEESVSRFANQDQMEGSAGIARSPAGGDDLVSSHEMHGHTRSPGKSVDERSGVPRGRDRGDLFNCDRRDESLQSTNVTVEGQSTKQQQQQQQDNLVCRETKRTNWDERRGSVTDSAAAGDDFRKAGDRDARSLPMSSRDAETPKCRSRDSEGLERESAKKQRCDDDEISPPGTTPRRDTPQRTKSPSTSLQTPSRPKTTDRGSTQLDNRPSSDPRGSTELGPPSGETFSRSAFSQFQTNSLTTSSAELPSHPSRAMSSSCYQWPQRLSELRVSTSDRSRPNSLDDSDSSRRLHVPQQSPFGMKSVRYTATEANEIRDRSVFRHGADHLLPPAGLMDLAIPPPPPPLIFKPKPISPDVTFDPQPDAYWEGLLSHVPFSRSSQSEELCQVLSDGRMCLVLDLDTVLFSTTKFSELDANSTRLLQSCLEDESSLPFFARSLHCIRSLEMWVKLRPGLNKFLRVARSAFRLYGHTSRSKEEVELILKVIDPDNCIPASRIIYQERAPGECIFKKMNSLGPSMSALSPTTLVLGDSCLPWEEMDAVFGIESYLFFPETKAKFGLTSPSMFETRSDEEDCGFLLNALSILLELRQQSFELMSDSQAFASDSREDIVNKIPKHILQLRPWDLRRLMAEARVALLSDVHIHFDRVLSPNEPHEQQIMWRMASTMGATCSASHTEKTTHMITLPGSRKIAWAQSRGCFVVSPVWIEASFALWFRLNEACYSVKETATVAATTTTATSTTTTTI